MFRILGVLHRIKPARAPTLLVAVLLVLLVARDASNDMVASLVESPVAGLVFQLVLMLFAAASWFFARFALGLHDEVAAGERPHPGPALERQLWIWWPRALFGAVAAIGATVSLRSAAALQALICVTWAVAGVALLDRRDRRFPLPPAGRPRLSWRAACPFGAAGWWVARLMVATGLAAFVLAAAEGYGAPGAIDLPALLSAAAPRVGAAVLCLLLMVGPLTAATMLADRRPLRGVIFSPRVPVLTLMGAMLLLAAGLLPLHQLRTVTRPGPAIAGRARLDSILASFAATCGPADAPVRPVIVALSGGASRAALWGARVLRDVDAAAADAHTAIFAVSSVSGGSLGAAAYVALRRDDAEAAGGAAGARCHLAPAPAHDAALVTHLRADMLGPLLVGTILDDSARALLAPAMWLVAGPRIPRGGDRAEALERGFSRAWGHPDGAPGWHGFEENFLSFFYDRHGGWRAGMPVWISNGTDVRNGRRLLTSPVRPLRRLPGPGGVIADPAWPFWAAGDVLALLQADVPFSTAIHNSARFPLLSPSGAVTPPRPVTDPAARGFGQPPPQIVDGGYFENSGLTTAIELADWLRAQTAHGRKVDPVIVLVTADAEPATGADEVPRCHSGPEFAPDATGGGREIGQLMAPMATLFATRGGHATYAIERARHAFCGPRDAPASDRFFHFYLHAPPGGEAIPLNWTLSARTAATVWRGMRDDNRAELAALRTALRSNEDVAGATSPPPGRHQTARLAEREADSAGARTQ